MRDHVANGTVALVAKDHLRIETLETRGMDNLDFHQVGVGELRAALLDAYGRGTCRGASDTMARIVAVLSRECSPELQADLLNAFLGCEDNSALSDEEADAGAEFFQCMADVFSGEVVDLAHSGGREAPKDPEVGNCFRITERDIVSLELQVVRLECKTFIEAAEAEWSLRHNVGVAVERLKPAAAGNVICLETRDPVTGEWQVR